jgi:hypothetical protein
MSKKLPPITGVVAPISPITVPSKAPSNILPEFVPIPKLSSIRQSPIMMFDHKTSEPNRIKLDPIKNKSSNEKETPRTVIGSSSNKSTARPKTASIYGRKKGGRKTRKAKKSKKTRKNRKSKSKRKTRRTRRK